MSTQAGLWIDHRKAVIVTLTPEGHTTRNIESNVERHVRYSSTAKPGSSWDSKPGTPEDTRERRFEGELDTYYDEVIACLRVADSILVMGPGEAKGELKARLEDAGLATRIVGVETADKMTDGQIVAKVRERLGS